MTIDGQLARLFGQRDALRTKIERRAAEVVRMWILRNGRSWLPIDDQNRSSALTDDREALLEDEALDAAVGNLPLSVIKYRDNGHTVILADLNVYLGLDYNDRSGPRGNYYQPKPGANTSNVSGQR